MWMDSAGNIISHKKGGKECVSLGYTHTVKMGSYCSTTMCHYWDMSVK